MRKILLIVASLLFFSTAYVSADYVETGPAPSGDNTLVTRTLKGSPLSQVDFDNNWDVLADKVTETHDDFLESVKIDATVGNQAVYTVGSIGYYVNLYAGRQATLILGHDPANGATTSYTITSDFTVPDGFILKFDKGAIITIGAGVTFTVYSPAIVDAKFTQRIFSGTGIVTFTNGGEICPDWWYSGTGDYSVALGLAVDSLGSNNSSIVIKTGNCALNESVTIPDNINLKVERGGVLQIATGKTLTINRTLEAGLYQIFNCVGTGAVSLLNISKPVWFGAVGDGSSDDTIPVQKSIDSLLSNGTVDFGCYSYRIARTVGVNDRWGITITQNDITLKGEKATLRRYDTDISTYSLAYPIIFIGTPDSNVASATENVIIEGMIFVGEDTRHDLAGNHPSDLRDAIHVKNTKGLIIRNNEFTKIDSAAITFQWPTTYDYKNSAYYNLTKSYNAKIFNNLFIAEAHTVVGRSLLHAIINRGIDNLVVNDNYFEWCDDAIVGEGTYDDVDDVETDTYAPGYAGWTLGDVKRSNRGLIFNNNTVYNSSEHAVYVSGMDVVISDNTIRTDEPTICTAGDIKIRSRNTVISGNIVMACETAITISEPAFNVTVTGNVLFTSSENAGGSIDVSTDGLTAFLDARAWYNTYYPMSNIAIQNNTIQLPSTSQTYGHAIRIYSSISDVNYPQGEMQGLVIEGNTIRNHRVGIEISNGLIRNVIINDNSFFAKDFTEAAFDGSDLLTKAVIELEDTNTSGLMYVQFTNNIVWGSEYLFATLTGGGASVQLPWGIEGNFFSYIKTFSTADFRAVSHFNRFTDNTGNWFLDRTLWATKYAKGNSLGNGTDSNSYDMDNISHNYGAATTDWTLTVLESLSDYIVVTNANGNVNAILPAAIPGHTYNILNSSGHILTFKVTGQTGGTIANGKLAIYLTGAADVFEIYEQP